MSRIGTFIVDPIPYTLLGQVWNDYFVDEPMFFSRESRAPTNFCTRARLRRIARRRPMHRYSMMRLRIAVLNVLLCSTLMIELSHSLISDLVISEFLASNTDGLTDEDGDSSDWIEIHNSGTELVSLIGLLLRDDSSEWIFPSIDLDADSYLIVFASDKNRVDPASELHTNFKLGAGGDYLGLFDADGIVPIFEYSPLYPPQVSDRSYGISENGVVKYFSTPSPGQANGVGDHIAVEPVTASADRGFYTSPIDIALTTPADQLDIRYTLDGSEPTEDSLLYSTPISISTTTVIRAASFVAGSESSRTSTYTYIYLEDVLKQPAEVAGFPNGVLQESGNSGLPVAQDFEMEPAVVADYRDEIIDSMTAIPTMSLTASTDAIFGDEGFYFSSDEEDSAEIERVCSMEILSARFPMDNEQVDVGVEGHSRNKQKRSLRLNFRADYGSREWTSDFFKKYVPLGASSATSTHKTLVLRAGSNRSWARSREPNEVAYTIDEFYRASQIAMSGRGSHGTFVHLYLNGVYWGLYNLIERPDDEFQSIYFGGDDDDWFFTNHGGAGSADSTRWDYLTDSLVSKDLTDEDNYIELEQYLDTQHFADYVLLAFWIGLSDWPDNNWFVANRNDASSLGPTPSQFYAWDGEFSFDRREGTEPLEKLRNVPEEGAIIPYSFQYDEGSDEPILLLWHALWKSSVFRNLFDERVKLHTGEGGALSTPLALQRWDTLNSFIESAIIGESARWGDCLKELGQEVNYYPVRTRTRDLDWRRAVVAGRALLEVNNDQFLEEYEKFVNPRLFAKVFFRIPLFRNSIIWLTSFFDP